MYELWKILKHYKTTQNKKELMKYRNYNNIKR